MVSSIVNYRPVNTQYSLVEFQNCMSVSDIQCREEMMEDMSMISTHESLMTNFVNSLLNSKKSQVISDERFDQITEYLRSPGLKIYPNFKHWITKERQFSLQDLPVWGWTEYLHAYPAKQKRPMVLGTSASFNRILMY